MDYYTLGGRVFFRTIRFIIGSQLAGLPGIVVQEWEPTTESNFIELNCPEFRRLNILRSDQPRNPGDA